ncbi:sugar transferase [bacterium]|nr:sugar transferase [bacterium]
MLKRFLDIVLSLIGIVMLLPLFFFIALKIKKNLGSPVLFSQIRPGKHCKPFELVKFRTMKDKSNGLDANLPDSQRLTIFGARLRSSSLDELPELWNVLKGDMSLVGPRPLLMEYLPLYSKEQSRRHDVTPGLTGWAQINGRNAISWEDKFSLDIWYVENQSFFLDMKILLITVKRVFRRDGISTDGHATTEKFLGSKYE